MGQDAAQGIATERIPSVQAASRAFGRQLERRTLYAAQQDAEFVLAAFASPAQAADSPAVSSGMGDSIAEMILSEICSARSGSDFESFIWADIWA